MSGAAVYFPGQSLATSRRAKRHYPVATPSIYATEQGAVYRATFPHQNAGHELCAIQGHM